jgi:lysozyme
MKTGKKGLDLIKQFEGLHDGDLKQIGLQPKMCPAGIWTEGWGRTIRNKGEFVRGAENKELAYKIAKIKDAKQADIALIQDLKVFEVIVARKITTELTQNEFDALVSHTYNTGGSSTLFKLVNERNTEAIKKWWVEKYITANGILFRGLVRRRQSELDLFLSK